MIYRCEFRSIQKGGDPTSIIFALAECLKYLGLDCDFRKYPNYSFHNNIFVPKNLGRLSPLTSIDIINIKIKDGRVRLFMISYIRSFLTFILSLMISINLINSIYLSQSDNNNKIILIFLSGVSITVVIFYINAMRLHWILSQFISERRSDMQ